MSFSLQVRIRKEEGALVRLLGLVTRRGYDVLGLWAELTPDRAAFDVRVEFQPITPPGDPWYRPPEVLARMVAKLYDVEKVELKESADPRALGPAPGNGQGGPSAKGDPVKPAGGMQWEE